ncbi:hypothetical protein CEXT_146161 [Caerostris extrusa]|uniref:Uncharacterized protein n=1 Tax=Caerostris extrusa TaxID=172846 RepID=A0AAV4XNC5_CAEEX|nr:hypothetical protein CEXT_146161 [Caerostris extrusa]
MVSACFHVSKWVQNISVSLRLKPLKTPLFNDSLIAIQIHADNKSLSPSELHLNKRLYPSFAADFLISCRDQPLSSISQGLSTAGLSSPSVRTSLSVLIVALCRRRPTYRPAQQQRITSVLKYARTGPMFVLRR